MTSRPLITELTPNAPRPMHPSLPPKWVSDPLVCVRCSRIHTGGRAFAAHHVIPKRCHGALTITMCPTCHASEDAAIREVCKQCSEADGHCRLSQRLDERGLLHGEG